jgi:hypothetical protein
MSLKATSAPNASQKDFEKFNVVNLACAVEGSSFDDKCEALPWKKTVPVLGASQRTAVMESAAKAARNPLEIGRAQSRDLSAAGFHSMDAIDDSIPAAMGIIPSILLVPFDPDISSDPDNMMDIQGEGSYKEISFMAEKVDVSNNRITSSEPISIVVVEWKHGNGIWITKGDTPSSSGSYEGVPCNGGGGGCFMNFRMAGKSTPTDDDTDYGMPATYGGMSQDLRVIKGGGKGAWEIDGKGEVQMVGSTKKFKYVPGENAYAVAKGKTYFHQLGQNGWQAPPNLFDPFWRAKLHPFLRKELSESLSEAGDGPGQSVADETGTAIEGDSNK